MAKPMTGLIQMQPKGDASIRDRRPEIYDPLLDLN